MRMLSAVPALPVRDLARSLAFYRDVLGFTVAHHDAGFAVLRSDAVQLHLWVAADAATASCQVQVDDVEDLYQRLKTQGATPSDARITDEPWGVRDFHVIDPDHNRITFFERHAPAKVQAVPVGAHGSKGTPADAPEPDDSADL